MTNIEMADYQATRVDVEFSEGCNVKCHTGIKVLPTTTVAELCSALNGSSTGHIEIRLLHDLIKKAA